MQSESPLHALLKQCHQPHYSPPHAFAVGLDWMRSTFNQTELIWHNRGTGEFRSFIGFNPHLKKGVVILSNSKEDWLDELELLVLDPDYKRSLEGKSLSRLPKTNSADEN